MKKVVLFLSACALLAACDSGYKPDGADTARANNKSGAEAGTLNGDSAAERRLSAVNEQAQVDTNTMKIGTAHPGGMMAVGAKLIAGSDCLGCHKEDVKLVGPAYKDVAKKYAATDANIAMLANRVITGGKGHWGEIPMSAHPALSLTDAKEMTKYILSLK